MNVLVRRVCAGSLCAVRCAPGLCLPGRREVAGRRGRLGCRLSPVAQLSP